MYLKIVRTKTTLEDKYFIMQLFNYGVVIWQTIVLFFQIQSQWTDKVLQPALDNSNGVSKDIIATSDIA